MLAFRRQPLKGLYLTYQLIATLFVRIPYWVLLSIPRYVSLKTHFFKLENHLTEILPDHGVPKRHGQ